MSTVVGRPVLGAALGRLELGAVRERDWNQVRSGRDRNRHDSLTTAIGTDLTLSVTADSSSDAQIGAEMA
jgi:hypothetical protein